MEICTVLLGGVEANSIFAESLITKVLQKGSLNFQESMLYLGASSDLATYVLFEKPGPYNDIANYLKNINLDGAREIGMNELKIPSILSQLADPFTIVSVYHLIINYLWRGNIEYRQLFFSDKPGIHIIPTYSFELHPDGIQHYIKAWCKCSNLL